MLFERSAELVRQDVIDEKISRQAAAQSYGVVIDASGAIDTAQNRSLARRASGRSVTLDDALDTPALIVDLDVMEANIARIAQTCARHGVRVAAALQGPQDNRNRAQAIGGRRHRHHLRQVGRSGSPGGCRYPQHTDCQSDRRRFETRAAACLAPPHRCHRRGGQRQQCVCACRRRVGARRQAACGDRSQYRHETGPAPSRARLLLPWRTRSRRIPIWRWPASWDGKHRPPRLRTPWRKRKPCPKPSRC